VLLDLMLVLSPYYSTCVSARYRCTEQLGMHDDCVQQSAGHILQKANAHRMGLSVDSRKLASLRSLWAMWCVWQ
jgi:hypothetical protein